ncbi:MAG: hypothetical protein AB7G93_21550 [Bdellovibrionales bacterium]
MIRLVLALTFLVINYAHAQKEDLNARDPRLNEGTMFTVNFNPKDKRVVVSLVGKPHVELGPERVIVFGREVLAGGKSKKLTIRPAGEDFEIVETLDSKVEIEAQDRADKTKKGDLWV